MGQESCCGRHPQAIEQKHHAGSLLPASKRRPGTAGRYSCDWNDVANKVMTS